MKRQLVHQFERIISVENLLLAWKEFVLGKRNKADVQEFSLHLMDNILQLHNGLANGSYQHGPYEEFHIADPKPRLIHKASVRDRLLHHAVYRILYPFFDQTFIADSYSCRNEKGTHRALERFLRMSNQVGHNNHRTVWVLKCDVRKFFASIDQQKLLAILRQYIPDHRIIALLQNIIESFSISPGRGLPLGNLTSQLLVNVYMNGFDQFVKHDLRVKEYIRYADDFVLLSANHHQVELLLPEIRQFLERELKLSLHPNKVSITSLASGIDFLGWIHFPHHRVLRTATRNGMFRKLQASPVPETLQSYLGLLQHGNTHDLEKEVLNQYWLWQK